MASSCFVAILLLDFVWGCSSSLSLLEVTMALLPIDCYSTGSFAVDSVTKFRAADAGGHIMITAKAGGKVWVLNHFIVFVRDDAQLDEVPEWAFDRKIKLMDDIMRRGTINTDLWTEMTTSVYMTSRQPS
jgi:hypothetical protein